MRGDRGDGKADEPERLPGRDVARRGAADFLCRTGLALVHGQRVDQLGGDLLCLGRRSPHARQAQYQPSQPLDRFLLRQCRKPTGLFPRIEIELGESRHHAQGNAVSFLSDRGEEELI